MTTPPSNNEPPPTLNDRPASAFGLSVVVGALLFLALPIFQLIGDINRRDAVDIKQVEMAPPPPPPPELQPPEVEEEEQEIEDIQEEKPPPDLSQMELALNADIMSGIGADFSMPTIDVGSQIEEMVFSLSELDEIPRVLQQVTPVYPPELKRARIEGEVIVEFVCNKEGRVIQARIYRSDNQLFNPKALEAVRKWRFEPGTKDGQPVQFRMRVPLVFNLN